MAAHLMIGLSRLHAVAGVGLLPATNNPVERRLRHAHVPVWHLGKRPGFDPRMYARLHRILEEFQPDVIHTHMSVQRYVFPFLLGKGAPTAIHTIHNQAEHETDGVGRMVHWLAFRNGVLPIGISKEVAATVKRVYGVACADVIFNCIPVECYQPNPLVRAGWRASQKLPADAVLFTFVGRLEPQKNPFLLFEAFSRLNDPRAHLVLVGEGSLFGKLAVRAAAHAGGERVHLLGMQERVSKILAASDVFVLGSNWEGNPLALMEAMSAGLPVVATAVGGVPEIVDSEANGILVKPGDTDGFASAMRTLLENPLKRQSLGNTARAHALRDFTLEHMVNGYEDLYRRTVMASRAGAGRLARASSSTEISLT